MVNQVTNLEESKKKSIVVEFYGPDPRIDLPVHSFKTTSEVLLLLCSNSILLALDLGF